MLLFPIILSLFSTFVSSTYTPQDATAFVGAQRWNESGWYADKGFLESYYGYFCLCECHASPEGIFCRGGGVEKDGKTPVAKFLGVFANENDMWLGNVVAFNNTTPFADTFRLKIPGGPSNYTGVSQSLGGESFVWRGSMSGVDCNYLEKCEMMCHKSSRNALSRDLPGNAQWEDWTKSCQPQL